jgi:hypothetical protein
MGLGELLDQIRQHYLDRLEAAAEQLRSAGGTEVVLEAALRTRDGSPAVEGTLGLPLRIDVAVIKDGEVSETLNVDTETMLSFDPLQFDWGALAVELHPFAWDAASFRLEGVEAEGGWRPLQDWFWRWFLADEEEGDEPLGAVHFLSDPDLTAGHADFSVDLGSAPVEAFEELLDAATALGAGRCLFGSFGPAGVGPAE